jgi:hypothetical protein
MMTIAMITTMLRLPDPTTVSTPSAEQARYEDTESGTRNNSYECPNEQRPVAADKAQ